MNKRAHKFLVVARLFLLLLWSVMASCGSGELYKDPQNRFTINFPKGRALQGEQEGTAFAFRKSEPLAEFHLTFFLPPPNLNEEDVINYYAEGCKGINQNVSPSGPMNTGSGSGEAIYQGTNQNIPLIIWSRTISDDPETVLWIASLVQGQQAFAITAVVKIDVYKQAEASIKNFMSNIRVSAGR